MIHTGYGHHTRRGRGEPDDGDDNRAAKVGVFFRREVESGWWPGPCSELLRPGRCGVAQAGVRDSASPIQWQSSGAGIRIMRAVELLGAARRPRSSNDLVTT